jgi:hypothetical protein
MAVNEEYSSKDVTLCSLIEACRYYIRMCQLCLQEQCRPDHVPSLFPTKNIHLERNHVKSH